MALRGITDGFLGLFSAAAALSAASMLVGDGGKNKKTLSFLFGLVFILALIQPVKGFIDSASGLVSLFDGVLEAEKQNGSEVETNSGLYGELIKKGRDSAASYLYTELYAFFGDAVRDAEITIVTDDSDPGNIEIKKAVIALPRFADSALRQAISEKASSLLFCKAEVVNKADGKTTE